LLLCDVTKSFFDFHGARAKSISRSRQMNFLSGYGSGDDDETKDANDHVHEDVAETNEDAEFDANEHDAVALDQAGDANATDADDDDNDDDDDGGVDEFTAEFVGGRLLQVTTYRTCCMNVHSNIETTY
jgi:hypothetical protein